MEEPEDFDAELHTEPTVPKHQSIQEYEEVSRLLEQVTIDPDPVPDQELFKRHIEPWVAWSGGFVGLALVLAVSSQFQLAFFTLTFALSLAARARYIYLTTVCPHLGKTALTPSQKFNKIFEQLENIPNLGPVIYHCKPSLSHLRNLKVKTFTQVKLEDGKIAHLQRSIAFNL